MIFIDTGAFLALYDEDDQYHQQAIKVFPSLTRPFLTTNHVIDELASLLARRAGYGYSADRIQDLYASKSIEVLPSTREDEVEAVRWTRKFADKEVSFTDCISFAIMRRLRIRTVFTFDRHFRDASFQIVSAPEH